MLIFQIAQELTPSSLESWKQKISNEFNIDTNLIQVQINPQLIAGYLIQIDSKIYDHSLAFNLTRDLNTINNVILN
jgi:F0F1-type ATP synthase delta subunit